MYKRRDSFSPQAANRAAGFQFLTLSAFCCISYHCVSSGFRLYYRVLRSNLMADLPKLEKKRALLAPKTPKSVGPLGKLVLLAGTALAGLGITPSAPALPSGTLSIQSTPSPMSTS